MSIIKKSALFLSVAALAFALFSTHAKAENPLTCFPDCVDPTVVTTGADQITATSARLTGELASIGSEHSVNLAFEYGLDENYGTALSGMTAEFQKTFDLTIGTSLDPITCGTTYHYRAYAYGGFGRSNGDDMMFTTNPCPVLPTVETHAITDGAYYSTSVNATAYLLDNGYENADVSIEYGLTIPEYGSESEVSVGIASDFQVNRVITGLACNTPYHFRAKATNSAGTAYGEDVLFTTPPCGSAPTVSTDNADFITEISARLIGVLSSLGTTPNATVGFNYGRTADYGFATTTGIIDSVPALFGFTIGDELTPLICGTSYHYRASANNLYGTIYGNDMTLTTVPCAINTFANPGYATNITANEATLNGVITLPDGAAMLSTTVSFEYGTSTSFESSTTTQVMTEAGSFSENIVDLQCDTTYYVRVVASNSSIGTIRSSGAVLFETLPCAITVTSPLSHSSYLVGDTMHIAWTSAGIPANANIEVMIGTAKDDITTLATVSNTNFYDWTIPMDFLANNIGSSGYPGWFIFIRYIPSNGQSHVYGFAEGIRISNLAQSQITVTTPNGGESYNTGDVMHITWTSTDLAASENVFIRLSDSRYTGLQGNQTILIVPNTGSYDWTIPTSYNDFSHGSIDGDSVYTITIIHQSGIHYAIDTSDAPFSIHLTTVLEHDSTCPEGDAPTLNILSPNGGETFSVGQTMHIRWKSCNLFHDQLVMIGLRDYRYDTETTDFAMGDITRTAPNTGSFDWVVPASMGNLSEGTIGGDSIYGIAMMIYSNRASDYADNSFTYVVFDETDEHFSITPTPTIVMETREATSITQTSAVFNGRSTVPEGILVHRVFSYGTTKEYGQFVAVDIGATGGSGTFNSNPVTGLLCGTVYHFQAGEDSFAPNAVGGDVTFTTSPCATSGGGGGGGGGGGCAIGKVDANNDCRVDVLDFVILMAHWNQTGSNNVGDFNSDSSVDVLDFVLLMAKWTK